MQDDAPSPIPSWPQDAARIAARIAARRTELRILLKTRNDPRLLPGWVRHHAGIVGAENLVIADNMSDDPEVLELLAEVARDAVVFRFGGFHNHLHDRMRLAPLYRALAGGARWLAALDTDERLYWCARGRWRADPGIVRRLRLRRRARAIPGLLIRDVPGPVPGAFIPRAADRLAPLLRWGKPLLRTDLALGGGMLCHNAQFPPEVFAPPHPPNAVILHLIASDPAQRLRASHQKLVARGYCSPASRPEEVALRNASAVRDDTIRRILREMRDILRPDAATGPAGDAMHFDPDGRLRFDGAAAEGLAHLMAQGTALLAPEGGPGA